MEGEVNELPLTVGMIICADDSTVVKKGVYGKIMKLETSSSGQQIGHIQWELPNPKGIPGTPLPVEVVNLDAQFKYIVEEDPADLQPLAMRSGLGAVAAVHGRSLLNSTKVIERRGLLTHVIPDLGLLQSGNHLLKAAGFARAYIYSGGVHV
jgi:hypothetical protein